MAARGARNLILLGRSGACNEQSRLLLDELRDKGVNVRAPACDISDENSLANALMECKGSMPPIRGCIQAAMVLKDGIFENMQLEDFRVVLKPKVQGSWNLHAQLPKGMDFFIFLSSVNGILGSRSQSNYGAGNTYEDALAKYRIKNGEKAVSLDLGLVNSVGFVAERQGAVNSQLLSGLSGIEESHLHAVLNYHCNPALPLLSPLKSQVIVGIETPAALKKNGIDEPYWLDQPICRHLFQMDDDTSSAASNIDPQTDYKNLLRSAPSLPAATDVVCNGLKEKLSKVLSIPIADIDGYNSISSHGTDSLVAVELRSWLSKEMAVDVAIFDILSNVSLDSFSETVTRKSGLASLDDVNNELKG